MIAFLDKPPAGVHEQQSFPVWLFFSAFVSFTITLLLLSLVRFMGAFNRYSQGNGWEEEKPKGSREMRALKQ